ncbi:MAG: serine protease, partial [Planktomarina sp.]|nr:serine protease [Planktomarina sp.]
MSFVKASHLSAQLMPNSFADLAEKISPSVVNITTSTVVAGRANQIPRGIVPKGSPFEEFFKEFDDR